ncbi:uncharacterized protein LOC125227372 [Leguminivora glycinivorella]|uniref:uncharacterized protein LOC125227372 n=1 Tax=Leguminivora glycinivorella TaxID=1035111 RepID=UPI00200E25C3|nr:uncharacterized protein LOC125227372 [Leguminivora glycinivorella]
MRVPEVRKCCLCIPLRPGIILCGYVNIAFSLLALSCLVITVELKKQSVTHDASIEAITSTVLFCILGMSVLLNVMLLVAGFQKDIPMLRLYNYFALGTTFAMLTSALVLLFRLQYVEWWAAFGAIAMQCYVIVLVRSEVIRLEMKLCNRQTAQANTDQSDHVIDVPDTDTLV